MADSTEEKSLISESKLKSAELLELARQYLKTDESAHVKKKLKFVYQIHIAPQKLGADEEVFTVDLKNGIVAKGPYEGKPDATFSFVDNDFIAVVTGKMNPQIAFLRGKLKVKGSMAAAQKFSPDIFPKPAKL